MFRGNPTIEQAEINGKSTNVLNLTKNNYLKLVNLSDEDACNFLDEKEIFTITWWENNSSSSTSWAFWINRNGSSASSRRYLGAISRAKAIRLEKQRGPIPDMSINQHLPVYGVMWPLYLRKPMPSYPCSGK